MDRIIKIALSLFVVVLVAFVGLVGYNGYVENAYQASLASSYTYNCTITTDSPLTNVTFFIPVPADRRGNSPIISQFSAQEMPGVPSAWRTLLYDTGKSTMVKVTIPSLVPPAGTTHEHPYTVTFSTNTSSHKLIDTRNPVENSPVFRPVTDPAAAECKGSVSTSDQRKCYSYLTSIYADYQTNPDASVSITSAIRGTNQWNLFGPRENAYDTDIYTLMLGENHGWTTARGYLETGIGPDDPVR
jgi:hypothetical protein